MIILGLEAGSGAGAPRHHASQQNQSLAVEDQAIVDKITWIERLVEIKIKSQTQNAPQEEDQGEQKDPRDQKNQNDQGKQNEKWKDYEDDQEQEQDLFQHTV